MKCCNGQGSDEVRANRPKVVAVLRLPAGNNRGDQLSAAFHSVLPRDQAADYRICVERDPRRYKTSHSQTSRRLLIRNSTIDGALGVGLFAGRDA